MMSHYGRVALAALVCAALLVGAVNVAWAQPANALPLGERWAGYFQRAIPQRTETKLQMSATTRNVLISHGRAFFDPARKQYSLWDHKVDRVPQYLLNNVEKSTGRIVEVPVNFYHAEEVKLQDGTLLTIGYGNYGGRLNQMTGRWIEMPVYFQVFYLGKNESFTSVIGQQVVGVPVGTSTLTVELNDGSRQTWRCVVMVAGNVYSVLELPWLDGARYEEKEQRRQEAKRKSLVGAIELGDQAAVQRLLANGADVNKYFGADTPLLTAILQRDAAMVTTLLAASADPNLPQKATIYYDGYPSSARSPLMVALEEGHLEIVQALLKAGADPNYVDPYAVMFQGINQDLCPYMVMFESPHIRDITPFLQALLAAGALPILKDVPLSMHAMAELMDRPELLPLIDHR